MTETLEQVRKALRYAADLAELGPLSPRFAPLFPDAELDAWFKSVGEKPHGRAESTLIAWLDRFATSYDVHGWLGAYAMHLLSAEAWRTLLGPARRATLLDVGAGAGYVTQGAAPLFEHITCTETSGPLRRRLRRRGFEVLEADLSVTTLERRFEVVSCFNVLDRTARPLSLLRNLKALLAPQGTLLLSMPLPLQPHVHVRGATIAPSERLPSTARRWEHAARELSERLLAPLGLDTVRLSRVPYLSRGDTDNPCYVLDDCVWVCRAEGAP